MIFLKLLGKFIKVLQSNASPNQIAWGFALGTIAGLTPLIALHNLFVLILIVILNVNIAAALLGLMIYSFFAWLLDPVFHALGFVLLVQVPGLEPMWTALYNAPMAPLTRFNNTVVLGSLVLALILLPLNHWLFKVFVRRYRDSWAAKIKQWKITKMILGSKLANVYIKIRGMGV